MPSACTSPPRSVLGTNFGTKFFGDDLGRNRPLWQLAVETPMRNPVDGRRIGVARVMPDAESEIAKRKTFAISDESEDHPELAVGRGQVNLEAGRKLRAVSPFGIAAAQSLDLDALSLELTASLPQRLTPARPLRIVSSAKAPSLKRTRA